MGNLKGPMPHCPAGRQCLRWAQVYLKDCVCNVKDEISFALGLISVFSWGVAEVPQIITNFKEKSTEGLSLTFLLTWVVGDLFNVAGCWLEPATLPTQFYMAMLYTITTLVLFWQTLYYGYICEWLKTRKNVFFSKINVQDELEDPSKEYESNHKKTQPLNVTKSTDGADELFKQNGLKTDADGTPAWSSPIPVVSQQLPQPRSTGRDLYYMSARSLARSHTPTAGSYLAQSRGSAPRTGLGSILVQGHVEGEDLLTSLVSTASSTPMNSKTVLCAVGATTFFIGALNLGLPVYEITTFAISHEMKNGFVLQTGRKLLQDMSGVTMRSSVQQGEFSSAVGTYMGWSMAAIYMGGRLPQIWLNIKRGTAEGLNPFMFVFALIGNATYVGSILVRSLEWFKIKPNMPWLVDAAVCILLDCFILAQFISFRSRRKTTHEDSNGHYEAAD